MVTGKVPVAAVLLAVSVRTLVLAVLAGLNEEAVTPLGRPLAPWVTVRLLGDAERLKFGAGAGAFTVRLNVVV